MRGGWEQMAYVVVERKIGKDRIYHVAPPPLLVLKHVVPSGMRGNEPICLLHAHAEYPLDSGLGRYI